MNAQHDGKIISCPIIKTEPDVVAQKLIDNIVEDSKVLDMGNLRYSKIGLDCGELDILRDNAERRIYIVDANNTPTSRLLFEPVLLPHEKCILSPSDRLIAIQKMADAFPEKLLGLN